MGYNQEYRKFTYSGGPITVPGIFDDLQIVLCVYELYLYNIYSHYCKGTTYPTYTK